MISIDLVDPITLIAFWLAFSRCLAILFQIPLFDNTAVFMMIKVLASLVITFAFFPIIKPHIILDINYMGADSIISLTIFYTVVGLAVGFFVKVLMYLFTAAGTLISQQIGFAMANFFDPSMGEQVSAIERIIHWTILIMILSSGALTPMFQGMVNSFSSIHMYQIGKMGHAPLFYIEIFKSLFLSALILAAPLIFTNVLVMSVLGIIARTVPQMNIIMVSFAVNIGMGLLVFIATSEEFFEVGYKIYVEELGKWFQFLM